MTGLFLDDLKTGQVFETAARAVDRHDAVSFAASYDPNGFHLDDEEARAAGLGGVIPSGFHTLSLSFRLFFDLHLWGEALLPSPGRDEVRWLKPVYPGDTIFVRATVSGIVPSRSRPDQGVVRMLHETLDRVSGDRVLTVSAMHRVRRRPV